MRVLMSGATGLIGREVGRRLVASGHSVVALVRDTERARKSLSFPADFIEWRAGEEIPAEAMRGVDAMVNLAGESIADGRWTARRKKEILDSRVNATHAMVKAASQVKVFVSGSATGFYGDRGDDVLDETSAKGEGFLADVVEAWEAELKPLRCRVATIRTAVVFSNQGGALEKLTPLFERGLAGRLGSGRQWMSWIHLDDIARLFVFALETEGVNGVINGCSPEPIRNSRFTETFARAFGKSTFFPVPEFALKWALGEMAASVLDSQRVLPKRALELGFRFEHPDLAGALRGIVAHVRESQR
jgi:uncharacterized protein (TIGR01777 family)